MEAVKYLERFKVPEVAFKVIENIVSPQEIVLLETLAKDVFTIEDAKEALSKNSDKDWSHQEVKELLLSAYKRGVIDLEDDTYEIYKIGSFYSRLDIFAIAETPSWLSISKDTRKALNDWYFDAYFSRLDPNAKAPTLDKVATLVVSTSYLREDGLPALEKVYGKFNFKSKAVFDNSLKYDVLTSGKADLAVAYTTEGNLVDKTFLVLKDDKQVWPPYNIAPIVRNEVLVSNPKLAVLINKVTATLNDSIVIKLNSEVDVKKREYAEVAKEYYNSIKNKIK